jgi:hypothetical protein
VDRTACHWWNKESGGQEPGGASGLSNFNLQEAAMKTYHREANRKLNISRWGCSCCSGSANSSQGCKNKAQLKKEAQRLQRKLAKRRIKNMVDEYLLDRDAA